MPFAATARPSLGLSLLKAGLAKQNLPCDVWYLHLRFAERIGSRRYQDISESTAEALIGEWIFAADLFGEQVAPADRFFATVLPRHADLSPQIAEFRQARDNVQSFLDDCQHALPWGDYALVGFTSMFQQNTSSLALAHRIKRLYPHVQIVFGGANCEGAMGEALHRLFPFIDYVCSGEGDIAFPELARRILRDEPVGNIPGIVRREAGVTVRPSVAGAPVMDMDSLPVPDFDDFIDQRAALDLHAEPVCTLIETSRGCWWGQKSHCTFCGLNGSTMQFRVKSPARAVDEFTQLTTRYRPEVIEAVDNILDMRYFQDVLPQLADLALGPRIFYETKANLRREQVRQLHESGVDQIQPGIESLNTNVLRIMRKGVSAVQNIQLLRWCAEYMVQPGWNLIAGFPGEDPGDYARQAELVPLLTHLEPPLGVAPLRLDRFSPLFMAPEASQVLNVRSAPAYSQIYPFGEEDLAQLAYYFRFDYADGRDPNTYLADLRHEVEAWRAVAQHSELISLDLGDTLLVYDTRPIALSKEHRLRGAAHAVYLACDVARSAADLVKNLSDAYTSGDVDQALKELTASKLMLCEDERYVILAVPGEYQLRYLKRRLGQRVPMPTRASPLLVHLAARMGASTTAAD
jgi:ribosomal peptide maturation radical SAM protein 1